MDSPNLSISNFKIFIRKFLIPFLVITLFIAWIFTLGFEKTVILNPYEPDTYKVNRILKEDNLEEIPLFGSSRMAKGLIPDSLGKNYYNYGLTGVQDDISLFFLREELKKNKKRPIVLNYDIDGFNYFLGEYSKFLYNINNPDVSKVMAVYGYDKIYYHIPFIKYFGSYQTFLSDYIRGFLVQHKLSSEKVYQDKGYAITLTKGGEEELKKDIQIRLNTHQSFYSNPSLVREFINLSQSHPDRKIIVLIAPYHPSYFKSFIGQDSAYRFLDQLRKLKNVRVFDFSKSPYSDDYFKDTLHLNYKGAKRFTHEFKDSLKNLL